MKTVLNISAILLTSASALCAQEPSGGTLIELSSIGVAVLVLSALNLKSFRKPTKS